MSKNQLTIRFAEQSEAVAVTFLLKSVAEWLVQNNQALWPPDRFSVEQTAAHIERSELVVGIANGKVVASMLVLKEDPEFWPEASSGEALYLHKIAVGRQYAGFGFFNQLISWAREYAGAADVSALRLDCAPREKLVRIYENVGFSPVDDQPIVVRGFLVKRMELVCG